MSVSKGRSTASNCLHGPFRVLHQSEFSARGNEIIVSNDGVPSLAVIHSDSHFPFGSASWHVSDTCMQAKPGLSCPSVDLKEFQAQAFSPEQPSGLFSSPGASN